MSIYNEKLITATEILGRCIGTNGVWADPSRYRYQCWTRDLVLAVLPLLIDMGETDIVRTHLENISKRQRTDGKVPILFLDKTVPFLHDKISASWRNKKLSFMLGRYLHGELENLTPGTKDSEILYVIGMCEYAKNTGNYAFLGRHSDNIRNALAYIEKNLMEDGLALGCDWRDTMERELGDKPLLTNNCLLYRAYCLAGETIKAEKLRDRINDVFWTGDSYLDYLGNDRFDPLGGAFAILYDIVPKNRYFDMAQSFRTVNTQCGVTIKCRHNPVSAVEREVIERTDGVVVWPFVVGFSVLALLKIKQRRMAEDQFEKLLGLYEFREWYDPANGCGFGADEQLWSATLFLRAAKALKTS